MDERERSVSGWRFVKGGDTKNEASAGTASEMQDDDSGLTRFVGTDLRVLGWIKMSGQRLVGVGRVLLERNWLGCCFELSGGVGSSRAVSERNSSRNKRYAAELLTSQRRLLVFASGHHGVLPIDSLAIAGKLYVLLLNHDGILPNETHHLCAP